MLDDFRILPPPSPTEDEAYEAGKSSVINGANTKNCHFRFFAKPELTRAWERGAADARVLDRREKSDASA